MMLSKSDFTKRSNVFVVMSASILSKETMTVKVIFRLSISCDTQLILLPASPSIVF